MKAVIQWVLRTMMKDQTGIVKTMPKKDLVDFNVAMTTERLMRNGVDPNSLKNANQVENALNMIDNRPKVQEGITSTKSAKVFDLEGKEIDPKKGIMGGKQIPDDDLPPPGSRGGPDDIAAPVQSAEETMKNMIEDELMKSENPFSDLVKTTKKGPKTIKEREAEILASMEKSNKETVQRIRNRKMVKDAIDNMSPGFVKGDRKYNAQLVADDLAQKMYGVDFYDLDQRKQIDLYDQALDGLSVDLENFATGGRAGFKDGPDQPGRRKFMKIMGGLATLPILGKFVKPAMPLIKKGAEISAPVLDKIIEVVMSAGKLVSQSGRRLKELTTKKKLKDIEVEEDMMDGPSYTIKTKDKTIYYRPGRQDESGLEDDIIEVIEDTVTKKAGGGIARMLGE
tara:strand:+ start:39 stop:1226 length:1188 start_codon:yes stop_codon:yes gene_type:complete